MSVDGRWWSPAALLAAVDAAKASMSQREFLRGHAGKPFREAWVAAKFASQRPGNDDCEIFPVAEKEQFPDFKLRQASKPLDEDWYEIVNVGDGRLDDEEEVELVDIDEEIEAALREIAEKINLKSRKNYSPQPHLLIYVNKWSDDTKAPTHLFAAQIGDLYGSAFKSIWAYWGTRANRLWPNPKRIKLPS